MSPKPINVRLDDVDFTLRWCQPTNNDGPNESPCYSLVILRAYETKSDAVAGQLRVITYRPRRDPSPTLTWDNELIFHASWDALAVFNRKDACGEGRALHTLADLGHERSPDTVLILTEMSFQRGYAASNLAPVILRHAIAECAPSSTALVIADFAGADFRDNGYPTGRGWAQQLGFEVTGPRTLVLRERVRAALADPATPYPKFVRRPAKPTAEQIKSGPSFAGRIFPRECKAPYDEPKFRVHALRLVSEACIADEEKLREFLLEGARVGDLQFREADRLGDPLFAAGQPVPAQLALGNARFEVPMLITQAAFRTPLHKVRMRLNAEHAEWLLFLLRIGDVASALAGLWRIAFARYDSEYLIGTTRAVDGWLELHDPESGRVLMIVPHGEDSHSVYCRVGTALDGVRPIAVLISDVERATTNWGGGSGGATYLGLREGPTVERWTQAKAKAFRQQARACAAAKEQKKATPSSRRRRLA